MTGNQGVESQTEAEESPSYSFKADTGYLATLITKDSASPWQGRRAQAFNELGVALTSRVSKNIRLQPWPVWKHVLHSWLYSEISDTD